MSAIIASLKSELEAIANNDTLYEETHFNARTEAIDLLESDIINRIGSLLPTTDALSELTVLRQQAEHLKARLEEINDNLFRQLRADIRSGICKGVQLRSRIEQVAGRNRDMQVHGGYDDLDAFVAGLLLTEDAPEEIREREREMVYYQPSPVRIILDLIDKTHFKKEDVFYDLGSGLGRVAILVHLLSGVRVNGIEFEPAYCAYARHLAAELNLSNVTFLNVDARDASYDDGTIFYLYSPFVGAMLQQVLDRLKAESRKRNIRICSYGPCTRDLARQNWLKRLDQNSNQHFQLALFESL